MTSRNLPSGHQSMFSIHQTSTIQNVNNFGGSSNLYFQKFVALIIFFNTSFSKIDNRNHSVQKKLFLGRKNEKRLNLKGYLSIEFEVIVVKWINLKWVILI